MANDPITKDALSVEATPPSTPERGESPNAARSQIRTTGGDAALDILLESGPLQQPNDPKRMKRLVRRIDTHIMPLICLVYFLQYIDKVSASLFNALSIYLLDMIFRPPSLMQV